MTFFYDIFGGRVVFKAKFSVDYEYDNENFIRCVLHPYLFKIQNGGWDQQFFSNIANYSGVLGTNLSTVFHKCCPDVWKHARKSKKSPKNILRAAMGRPISSSTPILGAKKFPPNPLMFGIKF